MEITSRLIKRDNFKMIKENRDCQIGFVFLKEQIDKLPQKDIDSIFQLLESTIPYENGINLQDWTLILELITYYEKGEIRKNNVIAKDNKVPEGAFVSLREDAVNKWCDDLTLVEFESFYPNVLINIGRKCNFNYVDFIEILSSIYQDYKQNKGDLKKIWINMAYGTLINGRVKCDKNITRLVATKTRHIVLTLHKFFPGNSIYADTDQLYLVHFDEIEKRFLKKINSFGLPYYIEKDLKGIFMAKKKYLIFNKGTVKGHGMQTIDGERGFKKKL